jgi:hypothetical protein
LPDFGLRKILAIWLTREDLLPLANPLHQPDALPLWRNGSSKDWPDWDHFLLFNARVAAISANTFAHNRNLHNFMPLFVLKQFFTLQRPSVFRFQVLCFLLFH